MHLCVSIPPKYSVAHTVGFLKGKSAVRIHRELLGERRMTGLHFWARGYCVSRVPIGRGYDEAAVRRYVREQERQDSGQERLDLNLDESQPKPQWGFPDVQCPPLGGFLKPPALRVVGYLRLAKKKESFALDEFFRRVAEREGAGVDLPQAVFHARVVMEVVQEAVSPGQIDDVRAQLPAEYDPLFEAGSTGEMVR